MKSIVAAILGGVFFSGAVFAFRKFKLRHKLDENVAASAETLKAENAKFGSKIDQVIAALGPMLPLDEYLTQDKKVSDLSMQLKEAQERLGKLDRQVETMQVTVEAEEAAHNALKRGREDAVMLVAEVKANKERLTEEVKHLEDQLATSLAELQVLNSEVGLTAEQQEALDQVGQTLENARTQLRTLADIHTQATMRFTSLETQFMELEKEFTKLVEKELSGGL